VQEILTPLNLVALILLTLATAALVGHASTKVISRFIKKPFGVDIGLGLRSDMERFFAYSALGIIFIIAYCVALSVFAILNQVSVSLVLALLLSVEFLGLINRKVKGELDVSKCLSSFSKNLKTMTKEWSRMFLPALFIVAMIWYISPAITLANYPGGDDRGYLFITRQIVDNGGALRGIDYPYAYSYMDHILMSGFMVVASFFYFSLQTAAFPTSIPLIHLFLALLYFSLTPISLYLFTNRLSKDRSFSMILALTALFMWRSLLLYFSWGGEGEAMGYFLVPVLALVDYGLNDALMKNGYRLRTFAWTLVAKLFLVATAIYVDLYTAILFIFLVIIVVPFETMRKNMTGRKLNAKDKMKSYLKTVAPYLIIFSSIIVIVITIILLPESIVIGNALMQGLYSRLTTSLEEILKNSSQIKWTSQWLVFRSGYDAIYPLAKLGYILPYFCGSWVSAFIGLYILSLACLKLLEKKGNSSYIEGRKASISAGIMACAGILFFLFTQDSPFGWYYISYPLASSLLAVRLYYMLNVFVIYVEALPLYLIFLYIRKEIAWSAVSKNIGYHHGFHWKSIRRMNIRKAVPVAVLVLVLAAITLPQISAYHDNYWSSRAESVVTLDDLDAFNWIEGNTPRNATFFVYAGDAGPYLYIYTGRIVLPPTALRAWSGNGEASQDFVEINYLLQQANMSQQLLQLLKEYNVSYIYLGERTQYRLSRFPALELVNSPQLQVMFHRGGTYIFKVIYGT
jgi:hypothetical protein